MDLYSGQWQQQQAGGSPDASSTPLCHSPHSHIPEVLPTCVDLSPSARETRVYPHTCVEDPEVTDSDDPEDTDSDDPEVTDNDDLSHPQPQKDQEKAISKSQRHGTAGAIAQYTDFEAQVITYLLQRNNIHGLARFLSGAWYCTVPDNMYWPFPLNENEAWNIVHNAEGNLEWNLGKTPCASRGDGDKGIFSVYNGALLLKKMNQPEKAMEKSKVAAQPDGNKQGVDDDVRAWEFGCDFAIFSRSERLGCPETPVVPFHLLGTRVQLRSLLESEELLRKLAHLVLQSAFELPNIVAGQELAKIALAFYKGLEVPESSENLPTSPAAIPKEFHIDAEGASDRSKVVSTIMPLKDPVLAIFLQDVIISNYLEQVCSKQIKTLSGMMRVHHHPSATGIHEMLNAFELKRYNGPILPTLKERKEKQKERKEDWKNTCAGFVGASLCATAAAFAVTQVPAAFDANATLRNLEDVVSNGDTITEVGDVGMHELADSSLHADAEVAEGSGTNGQVLDSETVPEQTKTTTVPKKSKKKKDKNATDLAGSGGDGESSTILLSSVSDATATNSSKPDITAEATSIEVAESTISATAPSAVVPSASTQPMTSDTVSSQALAQSMKSKKRKKANNKQKKNGATAEASSNATALGSDSQEKSVNKAIVPQPLEKINAQSAKKPDVVLPAQKAAPAVSSGESATDLSAVLSLDALGITVPTDGENDSWATVKSRSAQKAKSAVPSTSPAFKSGFRGPAVPRAGVSKQGPRVVTPLAKNEPTSKVTHTNKPAAIQAKDVRVFDPKEYPAMPTPPADKSKNPAKDIVHDFKQVVSGSTPSSESATVTPVATKASVLGTPKLEPLISNAAEQVDSDPEDLYKASPPRRTRATAVLDEEVTLAEPMKDNTVASKSVSVAPDTKPAVPESATQTTEAKKIVIDVPNNGSKVDEKPESVTTTDRGNNRFAPGFKHVVNKKPAVSKSSAPTANEKKTNAEALMSNTMNPKVDPKAYTSNKLMGSNDPKSKASSNVNSRVTTPVVTGSANHTKGKGNASTFDAQYSLHSDVGQVLGSTNAADGPSANKRGKKSYHKNASKSKGSGTISAPAETSKPLSTESKKPAAPDNIVASANQVIVPQSIPAAQKTVDTVMPTGSVEVDETKVNPQEVAHVPADLAWADLVSPTKAGYLKKRRSSVDNTTPDNNDLEVAPPSPVRRSSISAASIRAVGADSSADDDLFTTGNAGQKDPDVSFLSSTTDGETEQRDSRASPEAHITPGTELMLTPASPDRYDGEHYINIHGHEVTLFRRDAEISNISGQKHRQRTHSGPGYGNQSAVPASNSAPQGHSGHAVSQSQGRSGYGPYGQTSFNTGQGSHSHPQPAFYGVPRNTGYVGRQGGSGDPGESANTQSLGGDLKGKGPEMGMQGGMSNQALAPIPEASIASESGSEEFYDPAHEPYKCTFCELLKAPSPTFPCYLCPLCGVVPGGPRYCSRACLLANAWDHSRACLNTPAYSMLLNTDLGPTYRWEAFPLNNCHYMPDSHEKYRQKIFAMFCKYGEVPDIRHAHAQKWPTVDWTQVLPSREDSRVGDYHIFKSSATQNGPHRSRAHVICTVNFPLSDPLGLKHMIARCLNAALLTHDSNITNFLCRLLRWVLTDRNYLRRFGAVEPQEIILMEFKLQFYKEFGVIYNDNEPLIDPQRAFKNIEPLLVYYEHAQVVLQYWNNILLTRC